MFSYVWSRPSVEQGVHGKNHRGSEEPLSGTKDGIVQNLRRLSTGILTFVARGQNWRDDLLICSSCKSARIVHENTKVI